MNNNFMLIGRLVKDPVLKSTNTGKSVCDITLAVNNGKDDTSFIGISLWNKVAENTAEWVEKGDLIGVQGSIKNHNWEDSEGNKHYDYVFMGNKVSFLTTGKKEEVKKEESEEDPFSDFGEQITLDENFLD